MVYPGLLNLAAISGLYAQLTGVLAGFAFTALVVILTPDREGNRRLLRSGVPLVLLAAFFALVISSLTYSILAGDTDSAAHGRAATLEMIDGVPFGLAAVMLFHGVTLLLEASRTDHLTIWTGRVLTVVIAPGLTMYYIANGASDTETARIFQEGGVCVVAPAPTLGVALAGVLVVLLSLALAPKPGWWGLRRRAKSLFLNSRGAGKASAGDADHGPADHGLVVSG